MNSEAQSIFYNLRLLENLPQEQWVMTELTGGTLNICGFCCDSVYNNFCLRFSMDGWSATKECLKSLYCERIPLLVSKLMEKTECSDLSHLEINISGSVKGLKNIKECYKYDPSICAHMDSIIEDFAETTSRKIERFLEEKGYGDEDDDNMTDDPPSET